MLDGFDAHESCVRRPKEVFDDQTKYVIIDNMISFLAVFSGFALSFASFGIFWTGVNQWLQTAPALIFFIFSYFLSKKIPNAFTYLLLGATPLGGILMMFRDKNDSHALGISIVASWVAASFLAFLLATKSKQK